MEMPPPNIRIARNTFSLLPYMYFLSTENFILRYWNINVKLTFVKKKKHFFLLFSLTCHKRILIWIFLWMYSIVNSLDIHSDCENFVLSSVLHFSQKWTQSYKKRTTSIHLPPFCVRGNRCGETFVFPSWRNQRLQTLVLNAFGGHQQLLFNCFWKLWKANKLKSLATRG